MGVDEYLISGHRVGHVGEDFGGHHNIWSINDIIVKRFELVDYDVLVVFDILKLRV